MRAALVLLLGLVCWSRLPAVASAQPEHSGMAWADENGFVYLLLDTEGTFHLRAPELFASGQFELDEQGGLRCRAPMKRLAVRPGCNGRPTSRSGAS